ncbi:MAG TPA: hypothetical protein VIJ51_14845 [Solirubrobacteraceae bacterium]
MWLAPVMLVLGAVLAGWLIWQPPSPDLAGQVYRARLFSTAGFSIWDNSWYGGHYLPGYSLIFPPLASVLGVRPTGILAVVLSTLIFARLARMLDGFRARPATIFFALSATGDLFIGRVTFALGVTFGLAAVLACVRGKRLACAICSVACAAASPVAAAFLVLAACADFSANRAPARAVLLAAPGACLVGALVLLFPEGGYEPFALSSLIAAVAATVAVLVLLPRRERLFRRLGWLYLASLLVAYVVRSPMGSNAVRFGILFVPAVLAGRVGVADVQRAYVRVSRVLRAGAVPTQVLGRAPAAALLGLLTAAIVLWQVSGPIDQSVGAADDPAAHYAFYVPAIRFLESRSDGRAIRIEVPFTSDHWDATILGSRFLLARGWERQLDTRYDALFYAPVLTASAYEAWLLDNAVSYVALSTARPDFSSVQEDALIRGGLPFLRLVEQTANWQIYAVAAPRPLASGPGSLTAVAADGFTLQAQHAGSFTVRLHYTPYWTARTGAASFSQAPGGWTRVVVDAPGTVTVDAGLPTDIDL